MTKLFILCLLLGTLNTFAQLNSSQPSMHSHNDYYQNKPLLDALKAEAQSIEIDLFLEKGELFVAHSKREINPENTLEKVYIIPLIKYLSKKVEKPYFHLMIDLKTEAISTLAAVQNTLRKYPDIFNGSSSGVRVVISGNRPKPENYKEYDAYIWFDGRSPNDANKPGAEKLAVISQNISHFTQWRGQGEISENDKQKLIKFIQESHNKHIPVRFWNTPDHEEMYNFLCELGVDYINTDNPARVREFLNSKLISEQLPHWQKGYFDIHHINTGRGDAAFLIFPDGTTMVLDMGDMSETHPRILSPRTSPTVPDNSKTPAQWVADYIYKFHPKGAEAVLDYALVTHFHDDHFGEIDNTLIKHKEGNYLLTGIMELGSIIPVKKIIDRDHTYPVDLKDENVRKRLGLNIDKYSMTATLDEYWKYIDFYAKKTGLQYEKFRIGSTNQISEQNELKTPEFQVTNLFANGKIANSWGHVYYERYKQGEYPGENNLSAGIKISYGNFDYYNGGDISGIDQFGQTDISSMESKVAPVIGPVDVANLNHHGNRDSQNAFFVSTLRPKVWIQQSWSSDHPGDDVLRRITSKSLYPGKRDVYTTSMLEANELVIGRNVKESYRSTSGHIVVRVYPGGNSYEIFILNDKNTEREILNKFNYYSR